MKSKAVLGGSFLRSFTAFVCCVITAAAFPYYSGAILQAQTRGSQTSPVGSSDTNEATVTIKSARRVSSAVQIEHAHQDSGVKSADVYFENGKAVAR